MGAITQRKRNDGAVAYTAQIRITRGGKKHTSWLLTRLRQSFCVAAWRSDQARFIRVVGKPSRD